MEDPWGSPWATTDAPTPKIDLPAEPPSAHFSVESGGAGSSQQKTLQNPWEDGDAWGGWNDAASTPGGGVGRKRSGVFDSPSGWGGLSPAAQPAKVPASRGVSPDPWRLSDGRMSDGRRSVSRERSFQELKRKSDASLGVGSEGVGVDRLSASNAFGLQNVWEPPPLAAQRSTDHVSLNGKAAGLDTKPEPSIATTAGIAAGSPGVTAVSASESPSVLSEESSITSEAQSISRPESPVGLPPGPAIPGGTDDQDVDQKRKVSTKVQGLVDMYDGISRHASPNIGATSPRTPTGISMTALLSRPELQVADHDSDVPSEKDAAQADEEDQSTEGSDAPEPPSHTNTDAEATLSSSIPASQRKQHSRVHSIDFHVDMTNLDNLFPTTPPITVDPEEVPDVIIKDSFTSISERKTWYRISRLGAMRMHQLGDEENYVRVDWKRSAARQDTLKIVRRWMEEESGGRPTLGRKVGAIGGSVFNWNSSAPPVEIGELLRKRGGHSKAGSSASRASGILSPATAEFSWGTPPVSPGISNRPPSQAARTSESGARASASSRPQSMVLPRAAPPPSSPETQTSESGAGPGTSTRPQSMVLPRAPPPPSDSSAEFAEPPKIQPVPIITRSLDVANRPSIDQTLSKPVPTSTVVNGSRGSFSDDKDASDDGEDEDDGEEDDWGEMVTSPTAETSPWPSSAPTHVWPAEPVKISTDIKATKNPSEDTSLEKSKDEIISPGWPTVVSAQTWPVADVELSTNIGEDAMKLLEGVSPDKSRDEIVSPGWPTVGPTITWPVAAVKISTNIEAPKKLPEDTSTDKTKDEIISPGVWPTIVPTQTWPVPDVKIKISTSIEETKTLPDDTLPDESKDEIVSPGVWPTPSRQEEDPAPATFGDMGLQPTGTGMVAPQHPLSVPKQKPKPRPLASLDSALAWTGEPLNSPALSPLLMESPPPPPPPKSPRSFATTGPNQALFAGEEEMATSVLGNLPDLSYMLR